MNIRNATFFILPLAIAGLMPVGTIEAQQLLTCNSGASCNFCELARTINNVVDWLVVVATLIAVIGLMYAGFRMATSRGDVTTFTYAKTLFGNVVIGIFIIATAWLIIDVIVKSLTGGDFGVWNEPAQCGSMFQEGTRDAQLDLRESDVVQLAEPGNTAGAPGGTSAPVQVVDPNGSDAADTLSSDSSTGSGSGSAGTRTVSGSGYEYTYNPNGTYRIYDPAFPDLGLPEADNHNNQIRIIGNQNERFIVRDLTNGREYPVGCSVIRPAIGGCPQL